MNRIQRLAAAVAVIAGLALMGTPAVAGADAVSPPASGSSVPVWIDAAHRTPPPRLLATHLTLDYWGAWEYRGNFVDIWWGFDYNPANNHLRGYAEMVSTSSATHVQAEPLNLGDRNQILRSKNANSQTGDLVVSTGAVGCHRPNGVYRSNLHYSIRWPDGLLTPNKQTGQFEASASVICV